MADALTSRGVRHHWLGYRDSGMPRDGVVAADSFVARAGQAASDLADVIGEFRPDVLVTYDPSGGYPHPDHVATHQVSIAAVAAAAGERSGAHTPWEVPKVYYHVPFDGEIAQAAHRTLLGEGRESPFGRLIEQWKHHPERDPAAQVTTRVWAGRRSVYRAKRALLAHHTQVYPGSPGLLLPLVLRSVEKFQRVVPPPVTGERERSLLAGLARRGGRGRPR
jgi:mycothiol S-conjugate amidase